ncbi:MAG: hypothetical protein U0228_05785 [Myxococcaceae bacterium]
MRLNRVDEAITALTAMVTRRPSDLDLAAGRVAGARGSARPAHESIERARPFVDGAQRANLFEREAALYEKEERWGRALDAYQTASRISAARPDLHYRIAEVLERMGSLHSALDEVRKGRTIDTPNGAKATDAVVERLERALAQ